VAMEPPHMTWIQ